MIPLRDSVRSGTFPYVTIILIATNVLFFLMQLTLETYQLNQFFYVFGVVPAEVVNRITTGASLEPVFVSLITAMFLHGGWVHLIGNMWFLWVFGDNVEDSLGHLRFLMFYLVIGVIASLAHIAANPASTIPVIGASGAVAGVLGAYILLFPRSRILSLVPVFVFITLIEIPALAFIAIWFFIQVFNTFATLGGAVNAVAWWAHFGGFVAGVVFVKFFGANISRNWLQESIPALQKKMPLPDDVSEPEKEKRFHRRDAENAE